jgi:hypothetical protein
MHANGGLMLVRTLFILVTVGSGLSSSFAATENWVLDHSTITYTVNHPLKTARGTSTAAKGKGQCEKGKCEFLIAVPVKSFDSGDSNRDLHMLEVTRGGTHPMVVVQASFADAGLASQPGVALNCKIQFAGKDASCQNSVFDVQREDRNSAHAKGKITIKLSDFAITPPSLLAMAIKDEVPIDIEAFWSVGIK